MHRLLRRLKLRLLRAKLALYKFERSSVETRVVSEYATADSHQRSIERLANIDVEMRALRAAIAVLFEGNRQE